MRYRFLTFFVAALLFAAQGHAQLATQKSEANGVTVAVTPARLDRDASSWDFTLVFDTHSQNLTDDPERSAVLLDHKGNQFKPTAWAGAPGGGHHREGVLKFAPISPLPDLVELQLVRPGEAAARVFRWRLK